MTTIGGTFGVVLLLARCFALGVDFWCAVLDARAESSAANRFCVCTPAGVCVGDCMVLDAYSKSTWVLFGLIGSMLVLLSSFRFDDLVVYGSLMTISSTQLLFSLCETGLEFLGATIVGPVVS